MAAQITALPLLPRAHFAEARDAANRLATVFFTGIEPGQGHRLTGVVQLPAGWQFGHGCGGGDGPNAADSIHQRHLLV
jgi:hypothetical protein